MKRTWVDSVGDRLTVEQSSATHIMFRVDEDVELTCGQALELARHLLDAVGHNAPEGTDDVNAPLGRTVMVLGATWLVTRHLYEGDNGRHVYVLESDCGRTMRLDPHALARVMGS